MAIVKFISCLLVDLFNSFFSSLIGGAASVAGRVRTLTICASGRFVRPLFTVLRQVLVTAFNTFRLHETGLVYMSKTLASVTLW